VAVASDITDRVCDGIENEARVLVRESEE